MESSGSIWVGVLVRLRAFEASDAAAYSGWNYDSEQQRALDFIPLPRSQQADREWIDRETRRERHDDDDFRFVIENMDHQVVGDLTVHHADLRTGTFSYGISIARPHRRRGYAREAIQLILRYYFDELATRR